MSDSGFLAHAQGGVFGRAHSSDTELVTRFRATLHAELGPVLLPGVEDPDVNEVIVNPDGRVYFDRESSGMQPQEAVDPQHVEALARTIATFFGRSFNEENPNLEASLPFHGARFTATRPPITRGGVAMTLRLRSRVRHLGPDFVDTGVLSRAHAELLVQGLHQRRNVIVCGGLGTGKSALANALLLAITDGSRIGILEDSPEIECPTLHAVNFYACPGFDLETLAGRTSLRFRFDRICVGEIRDREAMALLQAWTSIRGGVATLHAEDPEGALSRLELLIRLARPSVAEIARLLIAAAVDFVVFLKGRGATHRRVATILELHGYDERSGQFDFTRHERSPHA